METESFRTILWDMAVEMPLWPNIGIKNHHMEEYLELHNDIICGPPSMTWGNHTIYCAIDKIINNLLHRVVKVHGDVDFPFL
jgi:hypothetical protein